MHALMLLLTTIAMLLVDVIAGSSWAAEKKQTRSALVIGIGAYKNAPQLINPIRDAKAIADTLAAQDFNVSLVLDPDSRTLGRALRDFGVQAAKSDVATIFYAGHGVQVDGRNYLIPADARLQRERDLLYEAMPLDLFLGEVSQSRELGIMIMDACRDNPFIERLAESLGARPRNSIGPGLARIDDTPSNTIVALATRANAVAADGEGEHSPYTMALLEELRTPGVELGLFFRKIRDKVMAATQGRQEPFTFGSLGAKPFYFNPQPPNRDPVIAATDALQLLDNAQATSLAIQAPTDPDDDRLIVQIIGLPRGGAVRIGDRTVLIGDYLTTEQLRASAFRPDGTFVGNAGAFEFKVTDGKGGSAQGAVAVILDPSNHPPVVTPAVSLRAVVNSLTLPVPTDPDGDPLTVTVRTLPAKGKLRIKERPLVAGQKLELAQLGELRFDAEDTEIGAELRLELAVTDSKGAEALTTVTIAVVAPDAGSVVNLDEEVWKRVSASRDAEDMRAFVRLFPQSKLATEAKQRADALEPATKLASPSPPSSSTTATAAAPPVVVAEAPPRPTAEAGSTAATNYSAGKATDTIAAPFDGELRVMVESGLRQEPSTSARRVATAAVGTVVKGIGQNPDQSWFLVQLPGNAKGWIRGTSVATVDKPPVVAAKEAATDDPRPKELITQEAAAKTAGSPTPPTQPPQIAGLPSSTSAVRTQGNGNSFRDCPQCPILVRVPAGSFVMGQESGHRSERPAHQVKIAKPFAIGKYEVTIAEWRACVGASACNGMPRLLGEPTDLTPVHNVHWDDANAFTRWLTASTGKRYRLPSESEWEYAARGGTRSTYWWGDKFEPGHVICKDCGPGYDRLLPVAVGGQPANPFGLHGMAGGVAEWTADCWFDDHSGAPGDGSARDRSGCSQRVLRGGSWRGDPADVTVSVRQRYDQNVRYLTNGFRVVRDLD